MPTFTLTVDSSADRTLLAGELGVISASGVSTGILTLNGGLLVNSGIITHPLLAPVSVTGTFSSLVNYGQIAGEVAAIGSALIPGGVSLNFDLTNYGTISGASLGGDGILLANSGARIYNYGTISGNTDDGIQINVHDGETGRNEIYNAGTISGLTGIFLDARVQNVIVNSGSIIGWSTGSIHADHPGGPTFVGVNIANTGTLQGDVVLSIGNDAVDNRNGDTYGNIHLDAGNDTVSNRAGLIDGDVLLGSNDDIVDNRGGVVTGTVFGEAGLDTFIGNAAEVDVFDGGTGVDTLDFRTSGAVGVALDGGFGNSGAAQGDSYSGIENVYGSGSGNDILRGDGAANLLFGFGGNDNLNGRAGADVLRGGAGVDSLAGGLGNDRFRYDFVTEGGDVILDFGGAAGNDDRFMVSAAGFGGGLVAGALAAGAFQSRADNIAQDADDRFIFRTTDQTVWFDADGSNAGAAVLIADLQAGAVVTAADFLIF